MNNILKAKIGFGTYKILDQNDMDNAIKWAIESGYDFIDTAKLYNTEPLVGNSLEKLKMENHRLFIQYFNLKFDHLTLKMELNLNLENL